MEPSDVTKGKYQECSQARYTHRNKQRKIIDDEGEIYVHKGAYQCSDKRHSPFI